MRLYGYWRSTAAYRVRIALNLKGIDYESRPVNLLQDPDAPEAQAYRALNPQGLVPALVDKGQVLIQSSAIVEYLEELQPLPALLPGDRYQRSVVRGMSQIIACDVHPLNNLRVLNYLRGPLEADDEAVSQWYQHWVSQGFAALEALLSVHRGDFSLGDAVTLADVYLVPQVFNARRFGCPLDAYPNLMEIATRLEAIEAFKAAAPGLQPDAA